MTWLIWIICKTRSSSCNFAVTIFLSFTHFVSITNLSNNKRKLIECSKLKRALGFLLMATLMQRCILTLCCIYFHYYICTLLYEPYILSRIPKVSDSELVRGLQRSKFKGAVSIQKRSERAAGCLGKTFENDLFEVSPGYETFFLFLGL